MALKFAPKEWFVFILSILLLTNLTILLDLPFLRQIIGFLFLTILPGLLILGILKLNKIDFLEKFILSWGLSISFLMFFGLFINNLSLSLGYETPLATIPLLVLFNIALIALGVIGCKTNKEPIFLLPNINLSTSEKSFLIVPILFPALSIFGMHVMNTTNNNIILMFLLFLIPIYIVSVCFFNHKFPKRLYPVVIFLISISLLLLLSLRSNHIIGIDTHSEYYFFRTTLNNLHWSIFGRSLFDTCLSISLLPTIYHSILNISSEFLFKILYSLIYSISPLVIYVLSKKYVGESYAFLASCFFMFQFNFLFTEYNARTNTAILFFALAMMILFSDKIDLLKKRILFIVFMASCMVSHYSTTYIFFFIILGSFLGIEILSKKYTFKKVISLTMVILFFALIFFWYSQVTETAFNVGVGFVEETLSNLNMFFVEESRAGGTQAMFGEGIMEKRISHKIEFVFTWLTFAFIAIGIITLIRRYKEMSFSELKFKKPDFLKDKFEVGYFVIALACVGLLVAMVAVPYLSVGYNLDRLYAIAITILSIFFVIGGIQLSKILFSVISTLKKKREKKTSLNRYLFTRNESIKRNSSLRNCKRDSSNVMAYLIILLVLIPYFFSVTGVTYNLYGVPRAIILNSEGEQYSIMYIHDQDTYGAKWLGKNYNVEQRIYFIDNRGIQTLTSQGSFTLGRQICRLDKNINIVGYIYLSYQNVIDGVTANPHNIGEMDEYSICFVNTNKIYANGASEIYNKF